jgi:hypothetical protein
MIPISNTLTPLPFYTDIEEQNHRRSYAYGAIYPLYAPVTSLLPFQFMREHRASTPITSCELYDKNGIYVADLTSDMETAGLHIEEVDTYGVDVVVYPAVMPLTRSIGMGQYYLMLTDGVETWYSDIITLIDTPSSYLQIEWYDTESMLSDAGIVVYDGNYKNRIYLNTELGKPEYTFDEEGETRDGYFFAEKQLSEKTYKFFFPSSEYLLDAMRLVRLSDYVKITDKYGRVYNCDTFLITPEWEEQGNIARVVAEFQTATVVKKIGRAYAIRDAGDFNDDYNDDYNH